MCYFLVHCRCRSLSRSYFESSDLRSHCDAVGFAEYSADKTTASTSRNVYDGENLTENTAPLFRKSQVTTRDDAELQTGFESNMTHQGSEPSRPVTASPPSSLTSLLATSDLLSLDLKRKIRRTGFSRCIPSFSFVNDNAQRNTMGMMNSIKQTCEELLLRTDGRGGHQEIMHDPKVSVPSATNASNVASTLVPKNSLYEDPEQSDLKKMTAESLSSGKRLVCCSNTI